MHIGDRLEQNCTNLTFQSLNIGQILGKYWANNGQIIKENIEQNILQILGKYFVNIV